MYDDCGLFLCKSVVHSLFTRNLINNFSLEQIIEKRRRDRINTSLSELRRLVPSAFEKQVNVDVCSFYLPFFVVCDLPLIIH